MQTYRQTDRQMTDGWATAYSEREREFTFAKNEQNRKIKLVKPTYASCPVKSQALLRML